MYMDFDPVFREKETWLREALVHSPRVPAVYLTSTNLVLLTFVAFNEINNLRVVRKGQNSDSPRLHHSSAPVPWTQFSIHRPTDAHNDLR